MTLSEKSLCVSKKNENNLNVIQKEEPIRGS
jgi:hypothetical protein